MHDKFSIPVVNSTLSTFFLCISVACIPGMFGANCASTCTCINGASCNHVNGTCTCQDGFIGVNCKNGKFCWDISMPQVVHENILCGALC